MRKIILIGGDLASGKSTYSKILGQKFNIAVINKDILKEILGDNILVKTREENKKLSIISFEMIKYILDSTKENIIVECNFKDYEMEELKKYLVNNDILSIKVQGENEVLHKRFLKRLEGPRHYVHRSQDLSNIDDFIRVENELRSVSYIGEVINVKICKDKFLIDDNELLNRIECFLRK